MVWSTKGLCKGLVIFMIWESHMLSDMSCSFHQNAKPLPQLPQLSELSPLSKRCRMANVAAAIAEAVEAMEAADAAVIQGDAPLIEDGEDEESAEPAAAARDDGGDQPIPAGDDQAVAAVQAVQAEGVLVRAGGENVVRRSARQEIAEMVLQAVGSTPFHLGMDGMLLEQEDIQKHAIAVTHAPEIFRETYDTQGDFSWSLFGFNTLLNSFYANGVKTQDSVASIRACFWGC